VDAVRLRGPVAVSATEWNVSELGVSGYTAEIEVDVDVDANDMTVDLAMQFNPVAASPLPLTVVVIEGDGASRTARVNTFGLAELPGVR
jgi:hypothetical protein